MSVGKKFVFDEEAVRGTRVLVCSLGSDPCEASEADAAVYMREYRNVDVISLSGIKHLLHVIKKSYDLIHIFSPLAPGGLMHDESNATLLGTHFIDKCCERHVKLLWIANDNDPNDYIKGFRAAGKPLNLIMTISRGGDGFTRFLAGLLSRTSSGEILPSAWAALAPQTAGPWHEDLPSCIFYAGRPGARLLR